MKRILSFLFAASLVCCVAGNSMAASIFGTDAIFYGGIKSSLTEMAFDLGPSMTENKVSNLFNVNTISSTFDGADSLSDLVFGGVGVYYENGGSPFPPPGNQYFERQSWFAVAAGSTADKITTSFANFDPLYTNYTTVISRMGEDSVYTIPAESGAMAGLLSGTYSGYFSPVELGVVSLAGLTATNPIFMDIWHFDGNRTIDQADDTLAQAAYQLKLGLEGNMVFAEITPSQAVPIPGAVVLLGSGLLGLVGLRTRNRRR